MTDQRYGDGYKTQQVKPEKQPNKQEEYAAELCRCGAWAKYKGEGAHDRIYTWRIYHNCNKTKPTN